jgi:molecular chaperone DnaK (HSP70)
VTEPVLAVDFGTSTSVGAIAADDRIHLLKEPASGSWSWPSAIALDEASFLVGTPAENVRRHDPLAYRAEFKRDLGDPHPITLGDKSLLPEDMVVEVLRALGEQAHEFLTRPVGRVVLTVPASFDESDVRRDLMVAAAERAGFVDVELLAEPVAAAFAPVRGKTLGPGWTVLVYDFGGGTFDAAVVRIGSPDDHAVIGHAALDDCGGRDIDAALLARLRDEAGPELNDLLTSDPDDPAAAAHVRLEVMELIRRAKHHLTQSAAARDYVGPLRRRFALNRAELDALAEPLVARTIDCCRTLLADVRVAPGDLDAILLVGGTTRMPVVRSMVTSGISDRVRFVEDSATAVAQGAARWTRAAGRRTCPATAPAPDEYPLRFDLPGGSGVLVRWMALVDEQLVPGQPLGLVRLRDGALWTLTADARAARLLRVHADVGATVISGDWLVTVGTGTAAAWTWNRRTGRGQQ